jgi:hypothetical protein
MGQHTSNLCEAQHRSAKSGVHAVNVRMSPEVSANAQIDKAEFSPRQRRNKMPKRLSGIVYSFSMRLGKSLHGMLKPNIKSSGT